MSKANKNGNLKAGSQGNKPLNPSMKMPAPKAAHAPLGPGFGKQGPGFIDMICKPTYELMQG